VCSCTGKENFSKTIFKSVQLFTLAPTCAKREQLYTLAPMCVKREKKYSLALLRKKASNCTVWRCREKKKTIVQFGAVERKRE
jgi:hypothetical protein